MIKRLVLFLKKNQSYTTPVPLPLGEPCLPAGRGAKEKVNA
ncbi:MAG: hypothetical protein WCT39_04625 [Candidatus Margulisiibacteriota bacterium]